MPFYVLFMPFYSFFYHHLLKIKITLISTKYCCPSQTGSKLCLKFEACFSAVRQIIKFYGTDKLKCHLTLHCFCENYKNTFKRSTTPWYFQAQTDRFLEITAIYINDGPSYDHLIFETCVAAIWCAKVRSRNSRIQLMRWDGVKIIMYHSLLPLASPPWIKGGL